jgi:TolA-binding protein
MNLGRFCRALSNPARSVCAALALCVAVAAWSSCGRESVLDKAQAEYDAGRYQEAVFLIRHYLKKGGEETAPLLFLAGKAWLKSGSEAEAEDSFTSCVKKDPSSAIQVADFLKEEAMAAYEAGDQGKGRRLMLDAVGFRPGLDFGRYDSALASMYLERKDFDTAIEYLGRYLKAYPKSSGSAEAMISLASAYEKKGDIAQAISTYTRFQESYPKSRLASNALWELETLLLREAQNDRASGAVGKADTILTNLAASASSPTVRERANFDLGEMNEERGDRQGAVRYYRQVIELGATGRLVERAKESIERLQGTRKRR